MEKAYTMAEEPYTRIYARIDLDAIVKNMEAMRENLPAKTKMIGVVKTDGYGHGAVPVAKTIAPFVWGYAVATLEEGQNLRRHGIDKPILVLGSTHPRHFAELRAISVQRSLRKTRQSCSQNLRFRWERRRKCILRSIPAWDESDFTRMKIA